MMNQKLLFIGRLRALKLRTALKERNRVQTVSLPANQTDTAWYYMYASPIVLHFYTAAVELKTLQELFGVASTTLSQLLRKGEDALLRALKCLPAARILWPSKTNQQYWALKSQEREPLVSGVFGFVDGKNLRVQEPSCADLQNAHYNGWLHSVFVTGVLCFGLDGTIIWGRHNCPGSWNDGELSRRLQEMLADDSRVAHGM
ncbi:hypothetical protein H310_05656 [Aphanomyces invadans]|uniref:DDE Tnp4 domain-containing protein n=1 Tax=Aphanomyces invadans TaxID=157072 RepID=A0A024UAK9_9STRA|nr:hypothetical protein H310_05656 [Aphanomyces invadans]ETW03260.1 hypothetical protein H310_05656 [Aphanomyces invadans]|eukprot:XP_008868644.1 hypothetical protein H310_05656 [Aphanomyces invadans]